MLNQPGHLDSPQDPDCLLYVSLLILGLDPAALEHKLKIPVNQKCFTRINRRLGDAFLHFLFVCLDREKAGKIFRDCWPLLDKKHESQFYKAAFEWYKTLQQSYRQPVPTVMAKTFMTPGGPKFTSTLVTLARTALHILTTKKGLSLTLLNTANHSRSPEQNCQTLRILQAFKVAHSQNYIVQQKIRQSVLVTLKNKARELCSKYRGFCKEGERAAWEFSDALNSNERLTQHQKDIFASASSATIQKGLSHDILRMNESVTKLWDKVDRHQQVEESAWKVLCPLLDGSTSFSHINGSVHSPQIPDMVYKIHANAINKLKLQGLYREGKLDLLGLVQYSTLALTSLLDTARNTHNHDHEESCDKIKAQSGQMTSLAETASQLSDKICGFLPAFNHSFSSSYTITSSLTTLERTELAGKPQLCPPAAPLTLFNKPESLMSAAHIPLQITPGVQKSSTRLSNDGFTATPRRLLCYMGIINTSKKFVKPRVRNSAINCKDDASQCQKKREPDLPSDGHITYQNQKGCMEMSKDLDAFLDPTQNVYMTQNLERSKDFQGHDLQADCRQSTIKFEGRCPKLMLPTIAANKKMYPQPGEHANVDVVIIPKSSGCSNPLEGGTSDMPKYFFTSREKVDEASPLNNQLPSSTSQERKIFPLKNERRMKDSGPDLQKRHHFITQTPGKEKWTPVGTKVPSRFGHDVSLESKCFVPKLPIEISYESSNLDELRCHSKARLKLLLELQESAQKNDTLVIQENQHETKSKPSFISYVETLKKSHQSATSENKSLKTERNSKLKTSYINNTEAVVPDTCSNGRPTENVSKEYYDNFTRMQSLLDIDEDTITSIEYKHDKDWLQQDEVFVSAKDVSHQFETQRKRSSILPESSVFDTLTDAILGGELDVSLLTDENVGKQIRRESLSSRRQSIANMRRLSLESSKTPLEATSFGLEDCSSIIDEMDCCLLSTSMEDA